MTVSCANGHDNPDGQTSAASAVRGCNRVPSCAPTLTQLAEMLD